MSKLEGNNLRYQLNNAIDNVITERRIINKLHNKRHRYPKIPEFVKLIILPTDLFDPFNKKQTDIRGTSVIRKLYKSFDVACIPITIPTEKDSPKANSIKQQIEIMIKLNSSRNFLKYYGISNTIDTLIMIKEWAELDNVINWAAPEQIENLVSYKYDTKSWNQNPKDRDQFTTVFNKLEQLAFSYYNNGISLNLTSKFAHHFTTKPTDELELRSESKIVD
uniref:Uncharacterized protein n=1 Tax=Rhizophagus irregularis (strain DAOM 181602 / DAOM 197198 / MUCL 43194) TaxID=747089 RepID=U9UG63_RHIID